MNKQLTLIALSFSLLAGLSACGSSLPTGNSRLASLAAADLSNPVTISETDSAFLDDVFSVLDANTAGGATAKPADKAARWQDLKANHADLAAKFEALKNLSPDQRKAKMAEVGKDHPELFAGFPGKPMPHFAGPGAKPPMGPPPGFDPAKFKAPDFKAPSADAIKAFEALKDLKPEDRKAKLDELRKAHPDWFPAPPAPGAKPPMGGHLPPHGPLQHGAPPAKPAN